MLRAVSELVRLARRAHIPSDSEGCGIQPVPVQNCDQRAWAWALIGGSRLTYRRRRYSTKAAIPAITSAEKLTAIVSPTCKAPPVTAAAIARTSTTGKPTSSMACGEVDVIRSTYQSRCRCKLRRDQRPQTDSSAPVLYCRPSRSCCRWVAFRDRISNDAAVSGLVMGA